MTDLINDTPEATEWVKHEAAKHAHSTIFGEVKSAVVWVDDTGEDGELLVAVDPVHIVSAMNDVAFDLLKGHDPGFPLGKVLSTAAFKAPGGSQFIAAMLGLYKGAEIQGFDALGVAPGPEQLRDFELHALTPEAWIEFCVDPREINPDWAESVLNAAPIRVERRDLSNNAEDTLHQLLRIGLPYAVLVWNPLVKVLAEEAGKDIYVALKRWLLLLLQRASDLSCPITEVISHLGKCQVSFIFRGKDVKKLYAAQEALSVAAQKAAALNKNMRAAGLLPMQITYEFDREHETWHPSFAQLQDGRLITDNAKLIAAEQLPKGMSLGLIFPKRKNG